MTLGTDLLVLDASLPPFSTTAEQQAGLALACPDLLRLIYMPITEISVSFFGTSSPLSSLYHVTVRQLYNLTISEDVPNYLVETGIE
jgi:hypothetical protein